MDQSTKGKSPRKRDADTKLAQNRLSVLELAKELGNVAEACRQRGLDRTSFYEWKRRFQTQGFEGLKDLPPIHKTRPQTTPPETVERIMALALAHPAYGCNRHEAMLALEGIRISSITIHPQRQRPGHQGRAPAGPGGAERRACDRHHPRLGDLPGKAEPVLQGKTRGINGSGRAAVG